VHGLLPDRAMDGARAKAGIQCACTEVEGREFFCYGSNATANGKSSKEVLIND
jgi:hypothetical protein